jgi:indole-3-glycerol phosphate synthase
MLLESIVRQKNQEVAAERAVLPLAALKKVAASRAPALDFVSALKGVGVSIIAEIKKASPSRGIIRADYDPAAIARLYSRSGAAAISVLTEKVYFQGRLEHMELVKKTLAKPLPVLRKDFIFSAYQLYQSRAAGADAVLLIAAILPPSRLKELVRLCRTLGMAALVEVHDIGEIDAALESGARVIGINNRNLDSLEVNLETTFKLMPLIPRDRLVVSESGIRRRSDIELMEEWGVDACLVGEALMASADIPAALGALLGKN